MLAVVGMVVQLLMVVLLLRLLLEQLILVLVAVAQITWDKLEPQVALAS